MGLQQYKLSITLAIAAAISTVIGLLSVYNAFASTYAVDVYSTMVVSTIAGLVSFGTCLLGSRLLEIYRYSPGKAAYIGLVLGFVAYLVVALLTLFALVSPAYYSRAATPVLLGGFMIGGFLAPLVGAITAYRLAKSN